ncbi:hypothetical protein BDN72DRAFT_465563 [Pluteus cervinus]|uniref:Uncharacterized protein n=1 Tax=Pluteus cervinus TaxID=181527 RepID=A0ACD3A6Q4_9AGAR|nr:hypothetical protein BDN72DRAFT_465563 [Pluteus cervinus]
MGWAQPRTLVTKNLIMGVTVWVDRTSGSNVLSALDVANGQSFSLSRLGLRYLPTHSIDGLIGGLNSEFVFIISPSPQQVARWASLSGSRFFGPGAPPTHGPTSHQELHGVLRHLVYRRQYSISGMIKLS